MEGEHPFLARLKFWRTVPADIAAAGETQHDLFRRYHPLVDGLDFDNGFPPERLMLAHAPRRGCGCGNRSRLRIGQPDGDDLACNDNRRLLGALPRLRLPKGARRISACSPC